MPSHVGTVSAVAQSYSMPAVPLAGNPMAAYQSTQILGASPMQLVLILYDLALTACGRRDVGRARRAVTELIAALNFDYEEIAVPLFRLYEYCLGAIGVGSFHEAAKVLRQLKEAWETALKQSGQLRDERCTLTASRVNGLSHGDY